MVTEHDERLAIALRAYTDRQKRAAQGPGKYRRPEDLFIFDTETTVDTAQSLTFGSYSVYRLREARRGHGPEDYRLIEKGLFYGDSIDEESLAALREYAREHGLACQNRRDFVRKVFLHRAYELQALVIGFNLPFDLSRIAAGWGEARRGPVRKGSDGRPGIFASGFSLFLDGYEDVNGRRQPNRFLPRIAIKTIDSKRHLISFLPPRTGGMKGQKGFRGHFLDARTLAFALTDRSYSLASAGKAFSIEHPKLEDEEHGGVVTAEYIDYNRRDVLATFELTLKLLEEYDSHPISPAARKAMRSKRPLQETKAFSPASVGKAYLRAMNISPILERQPDFPPEVLGYAMMAFYGGRAECRIRRTPVPVTYLDFAAQYPTINALGLWDFQIAARIDVEEATGEVRAFLERVTPDDLLRPETWRQLAVLVEVEPEDDILPVRARYEAGGQNWQIGVNPVRTEQPLWYALADAIVSKLMTGRAPRIRRALRLVPVGRLKGLRPVRLRGEVEVDPREQDFFRAAIEQRKRLKKRADLSQEERDRLDWSLKVLTNATSYGIFAEMNRRELPLGERASVEVFGLDGPFTCETTAVEEPGEYYFAPIAAFITGGARLMLALAEYQVARVGGTYAMCDTDSLAIVATETGGQFVIPGTGADGQPVEDMVHALSWQQVQKIRATFEALNPYDREAVPGSILELEDVNRDPVSGVQREIYCYAISAKRYCFYRCDEDGNPRVEKWYEDEDDLGELEDDGARRELVGKRTWSEHGLGHLMNPTDPKSEDREWIRQAWEALVREHLGMPAQKRPFADRPAVARISASTPAMLRPFKSFNEGLPYDRQIKPFNFLQSAHVAPFGYPPDADPERFHLVAPFSNDPKGRLKMKWVDRYSGRSYRITTSQLDSAAVVKVKSYSDVLAEYATHPEAKSLGPDGKPCSRQTAGLMRLRPVEALPFGPGMSTYVGKESNRLEDVKAGLVHDASEVTTVYEPGRDWWDAHVLPRLRKIPLKELSKATGMSRTALKDARAGKSYPRRRNRERLLETIGMEEGFVTCLTLDELPKAHELPCSDRGRCSKAR